MKQEILNKLSKESRQLIITIEARRDEIHQELEFLDKLEKGEVLI